MVNGLWHGVASSSCWRCDFSSRPAKAGGHTTSFPRRAFAPELCQVHGFEPSPPIFSRCSVASGSRPMPVEALAKRRFGTDDGRVRTEERKNERKIGGETPTDAIQYSAVATATAAPWIAKAHIYRRSTAVLVPRSLSSARDSASGQVSWDAAGTRFAHPFERALPAPAYPSPATAPRAPVVVPER
jgi:hypothetical protein